jgi:two-component system sensor histidine kinase CpxA
MPPSPDSAGSPATCSTSEHALSERECLPIGLQILLWFSLNLLLLCVIGIVLFLTQWKVSWDSLPQLGSQHALAVSFGISSALVLGSIAFWIPLCRRITRPIRRVQRAASALAQGNFHVRVPVERRDELGSLATSLNELAAQLEGVLSSKYQFLSDIAHELGSPLARMEWALSIAETKAGAEMHPELADIREEVTQMSALLRELLSFSKDGITPDQKLESVCLRTVANAALLQETAPTERVDMRQLEALRVQANPHLLQRAVANVVRNALRYAGPASLLRVESERTPCGILLRVSDNGPGVAPEDLNRLCEPFFRPESARSRQTGGVGLGLSIVKRCVEACAGTLTLRPAQPTGLSVEIILQEAAPA